MSDKSELFYVGWMVTVLVVVAIVVNVWGIGL